MELSPPLLVLRWGALALGLALLSQPIFADDALTGGSTGALTGTPAVVCSRLASAQGSAALFDPQDRELVIAFYMARQCLPLWVDEQGPTRAAERAIAELAQAATWGLNAPDFKLVAVNPPFASGRWSAEQMANAEFELTAAILRYAHQAQGGRIPQPDELLSSYLDRQPVISGASDVLTQISEADDPGEVLRSYQPAQDQFLKLKGLLANLKGKSGTTEEFKISRHGPTLQLGSQNPEVAILKKRFAVAPEADTEQVFDQPLADVVKKFQMSNGLVSDGIVGPETRAALAGDVADKNSEKITAVIANMEEWRWMPRSLGETLHPRQCSVVFDRADR